MVGPRTVVAIGEALWDVFPDRRLPGGAPCNVAFHAARLGDRGMIITRVGRDDAGDELVTFLDERGVVTDHIQRDEGRPTGTVVVTIEDSEPRYAITEDVAWDYMAADERSRELARTADAICVGSLAQRSARSHSAIHQLLLDARGHALVIFDVNLRPPFVDPTVLDITFRLADVVKMSESEIDRASTLLGRPSLTAWLLGELGVQAVCVTRGRDGASITTPTDKVSAPGIKIDVSSGDAVGAGDAFTASMAHQFLRNATPQEALTASNRYAALVARKKGAMPALSDEELTAIGL